MKSKGKDKPEIGEVVMIKEELTNHGKWKLRRIISLIEGKDGVTREATLRVISGGNPRGNPKANPEALFNGIKVSAL